MCTPRLWRRLLFSTASLMFWPRRTSFALRRVFRLGGRAWINLDKTSTTLLALMLGDIPEEEARMFDAAGTVLDVVMEVAA